MSISFKLFINGGDVSFLNFANRNTLATVRFELDCVQDVPVPASLLLLASCVLGLLGLRKKQQS